MSKENESKPNSSVTYTLKHPIEWATDGTKKLVNEVTFRRPRGKDIKSIGKDMDLGKLLDIAAKVSDYSPRFFDALDGLDYIKISEVIGDFLDDGQEIGRTS